MANVMYSFAIMTFDTIAEDIRDENGEPLPRKLARSSKRKRESGKAVTTSNEKDLRLQNTWNIHEILLECFKNSVKTSFEKENFDQFAIYFELMRVVPKGRELVQKIIGEHPSPSGPSATVPSRLHAQTAQAMHAQLLKYSEDFDIFNEFSGLQGVFPIDTAVYYKEKLVALVEIDGEYHYKSQQLRRKDRLKHFLYRYHYKNIPLYRMKYDQINVITTNKAGEALANWIAKDLFQKEQHN